MAKAKKQAEPEFEGGIQETEEGGIVVDFGGVEDDGGFPLVSQGWHECEVEEVEYKISSNNNPMWMVTFVVLGDSEHAGKKLFNNVTFVEKAMPMAKKAIAAMMPSLLEERFDPEQVANDGVLVGATCACKVKHKAWEGQMRSNVTDIKASSGEAAFV